MLFATPAFLTLLLVYLLIKYSYSPLIKRFFIIFVLDIVIPILLVLGIAVLIVLLGKHEVVSSASTFPELLDMLSIIDVSAIFLIMAAIILGVSMLFLKTIGDGLDVNFYWSLKRKELWTMGGSLVLLEAILLSPQFSQIIITENLKMLLQVILTSSHAWFGVLSLMIFSVTGVFFYRVIVQQYTNVEHPPLISILIASLFIGSGPSSLGMGFLSLVGGYLYNQRYNLLSVVSVHILGVLLTIITLKIQTF